ncbi:hypothetical protein FACS189445_2150 [Spirochaetia bacterium]|nr:hypothetical protein FACS189445_2150 [Spirochaetia bacterium]
MKKGFLLAAAAVAALTLAACDMDGDTDIPPAPPLEWTAIDDAQFGDLKALTLRNVAWGNGRFVAVGGSGSGPTTFQSNAFYSTDGITWTAASDTSGLNRDNISGLNFGGGIFLA